LFDITNAAAWKDIRRRHRRRRVRPVQLSAGACDNVPEPGPITLIGAASVSGTSSAAMANFHRVIERSN
jgi:hypothetical protein